LGGVDEESVRSELVDDLMFEPEPDSAEPAPARRQWVQRLRTFWHAAIRWPLWPVTVIAVTAVVGALIYLAVVLIAGFFAGVVE
jgi:type VI protein secretion system component VasF